METQLHCAEAVWLVDKLQYRGFKLGVVENNSDNRAATGYEISSKSICHARTFEELLPRLKWQVSPVQQHTDNS